jgi:hypothetical protein
MTDEAASTAEQTTVQGGDPDGAAGASQDPEVTGTAEQSATPEAIDYEKLDYSKIDVSRIPLESVLEREDLNRHLQSLKDREASRIENKLRQEAADRAEQARKDAEALERRQYLEEEDYDALGRKEADRMREEQAYLEAATKISASVETALKQHPEFRVLGEETIEQVYNDVRSKGGNIVDFTTALSEKRRQHDVSSLGEQLRKEQREELEALLTERGLGKREAQVESQETVVASVSGATAGTGQKPLSYEEASVAYGEGDLSYAEFKPFLEAHNKERGK